MMNKIRNMSPEYMIASLITFFSLFVLPLAIFVTVIQVIWFIVAILVIWDESKWNGKKGKDKFINFIDNYKWWMALLPFFFLTIFTINKVKQIKNDYKQIKNN